MAKTDFKTIDDYLAAQPDAARAVLAQVRAAIGLAIPEAVETISYQIPAYRLAGGVAIFFAGWKQHYSLYPVTDALLAAFAEALAPYEISKGTIRFPLDQPVPADLISAVARFKADEVIAGAASKATSRKKPG